MLRLIIPFPRSLALPEGLLDASSSTVDILPFRRAGRSSSSLTVYYDPYSLSGLHLLNTNCICVGIAVELAYLESSDGC
jgi:hypothetical protein